MCDCSSCANAVWDYYEYYGTTKKNWFVEDCKLGLDESEDCEGYEEVKDEDWQ